MLGQQRIEEQREIGRVLSPARSNDAQRVDPAHTLGTEQQESLVCRPERTLVKTRRLYSRVCRPCTGAQTGPASCILGDHRFVRHESYIDYRHCRTDSITHLTTLLNSGYVKRMAGRL